MLMIPLPFLFASAALWAIWLHWREPVRGVGYAVLALALLAVQMGVIGARFGYGLDWLAPVQLVLAVLVPPALWLAFARPVQGFWLGLCGLPLLGLAAVGSAWPQAMDGYIALIGFGFAAALVRLGMAGEAAFAAVPFGRLPGVIRWLWASVVLLLATSVADLLATAMAVMGWAGWTGAVVAGAMLLTLALAALIVGRRKPAAEVGPDHAPLFDRVERLMAQGVFRDPDLTLVRIARKLSVPQRDVSRAVNACAGVNLSQYVNKYRIEAACVALRQTDHPVTQVMFEAGFVTKSNFNKEFGRITGVSPSAWRRGVGAAEGDA